MDPRRREDRLERRRQGRVRRLIAFGHANRRNLEARHNTLDYACVNWMGDMRPARNDTRNREFDGTSTRMDARRCVVCRPYETPDETALLTLEVAL